MSENQASSAEKSFSVASDATVDKNSSVSSADVEKYESCFARFFSILFSARLFIQYFYTQYFLYALPLSSYVC